MTRLKAYFATGDYGPQLYGQGWSLPDCRPGSGPGRFGQIVEAPPCQASARDLELLAQAMSAPPAPFRVPGEFDPNENPAIPAGYTYFGQYIDHDISLDRCSKLGIPNAPDQLPSHRTPRFDLDSLYGKGFEHEPLLYVPDTGELLQGRPINPVAPDIRQVLRNARGELLIPERRNDENVIVAQLHATFTSFHNRVVASLSKGTPSSDPADVCARASEIVRWHYQWLVLWDYLPRICGPGTAAEIDRLLLLPSMDGRPRDGLRFFKPRGDDVYMPVEFSYAAFRFGHSMIRPGYYLNDLLGGPPDDRDRGGGGYGRLPIFDASESGKNARDLRGFRQIPDRWPIDWKYFFPLGGSLSRNISETAGSPPRRVVFKGPQASYRITHELVAPLNDLPDAKPTGATRNALALLDLLRGQALQLPSGQAVARAFGIAPLTDDDLRPPGKTIPPALLTDTPLFYYLLREADVLGGPTGGQGGQYLGPVGRIIVMETIVGLMLHDPKSVLHQPGWRPKCGAVPGEPYEVRHLLKYVYPNL